MNKVIHNLPEPEYLGWHGEPSRSTSCLWYRGSNISLSLMWSNLWRVLDYVSSEKYDLKLFFQDIDSPTPEEKALFLLEFGVEYPILNDQ